MGKHRKMKAGKKKKRQQRSIPLIPIRRFVCDLSSKQRAGTRGKKPSRDESPTSLTPLPVPAPLAFTRSLLKTNNICLDLKQQHVLNRNGM